MMRLSIELTGRNRRLRREKPTRGRSILSLVALPVMIIGGILAISAFRCSDPVPGVSADDDKLIRAHLREIAPPPAMAVRVRDAMQVFRANVMPNGDTPIMVTGLMIGPGAIVLNTQ